MEMIFWSLEDPLSLQLLQLALCLLVYSLQSLLSIKLAPQPWFPPEPPSWSSRPQEVLPCWLLEGPLSVQLVSAAPPSAPQSSGSK